MDIGFDIAALHQAYAAGADPGAVVDEAYARLAAANDPGIFITLVDRERARAAARALPKFDIEKYPLWGVPFAVKDNIDVAALPTTAGCREFAYTPAKSAPVVSALVAAGGILIGKTNLDQFAAGLVGVRTPYPVPRNAIDPAIVPGGSSSGSAVAVARGIVAFALGTDTAGSGRIPAALNNIVGLKPSRGVLSATGVVPACRSLDCVSVFAATTADAWAVANVAAGYDAEDPYSRHLSLGTMARPSVVRLGVPDKASRIFDSAVAEAAFDAALAAFPDFGPDPVAVDLAPFFAAAQRLYEGAWVAERYAAIRSFVEAKPEALFPATRTIIEGSRRFSAADAFEDQYRLAALAKTCAAVWEKIDVLVVPSMPDVCTLEQIAADPLVPNRRLGTYTNFVNLLDLCAVAVPGPFRSDGRAAGVTLIAPAGRDGLLAALAAEIHAAANVPVGATGRPLPPHRSAATHDGASAVPLAVVGAHMSGMALNGELSDRGGVFLRAEKTAPAYRLYALNGGPPERPGLVRVRDGGAAIAVELWALPPAALGDLMTGVPAPLAIGTVTLADGTSVKGFVCEAAGAEGARDITAYGGWRKYVASRG